MVLLLLLACCCVRTATSASPTCFVIVSEMRSGSTAFLDMLARALPNVRAYGELMHRYGAYYSATVNPHLKLYQPPPS